MPSDDEGAAEFSPSRPMGFYAARAFGLPKAFLSDSYPQAASLTSS